MIRHGLSEEAVILAKNLSSVLNLVGQYRLFHNARVSGDFVQNDSNHNLVSMSRFSDEYHFGKC
jgi:hypothetical protein